MKALLHRRGRAAAVIGGLVAAGATTVLVMVGTASAAEQGRCTDNVNVRSQPSATASVVTVCKRGTDVTIGERRNGYVQLTNLNGWASEQYVSANPGRSGSATTTKSTTSHSAPTTSGSARGEQVRPTTPSTTTAKSSEQRRSTGSASPTTTAPRTTSSSQAPADTARDAGTSGGGQGGSGESSESAPARSGGLLG
ncbi:MAG: SH3 domain-containing protein [Pseudonocardia sp.]|uniref:SH3 domain-containing protein n=1 Tax=unclassified Pseudonocardia TaxID=2619320 RepID=UPI00086B935E|nr:MULTISPECIES: SH3 domain-containing protein [unclassified Pseudonocardia]MBN9112739.1 SH3 domain-containing protein [Pseudonocardia sp.]ODV00327.1 MAG: hypothetical protein ABT15_29385 [Pseudonocardia sp. SCN 73-27]